MAEPRYKLLVSEHIFGAPQAFSHADGLLWALLIEMLRWSISESSNHPPGRLNVYWVTLHKVISEYLRTSNAGNPNRSVGPSRGRVLAAGAFLRWI